MTINENSGPTEPESVLVGDILVHSFDSPKCLAEHVIQDDGSLTPGLAVAINPEKIMRAREDASLAVTLKSATIRYADGAGVVWAMRRKGISGVRVPGVEVWGELMRRAAEKGVPVFLLGARENVLTDTVAKLQQEFPQIIIAASTHGYSSDKDMEAFASALAGTQAAVVAVAMGSPKQEQVIAELRQNSRQAFFMGVGGTFDCYTGAVPRAPSRWRNANLEWLFRLLQQPSRIWRQWVLLPYVFLTLIGRI